MINKIDCYDNFLEYMTIINNKKIDEYYNKLLEYSYEFKHEIDVTQREYFIKETIKKLIDNNEDYLLTDSFLNYVAHDHHYIAKFDYIVSNQPLLKYNILDSYFDSINGDYISMENHSQVDYHIFSKSLDFDTRKATLLAKEYRTKMRNKYYYNLPAYDVLYYIFNSILSYCYINQRMSEYEEICRPLFDNPDDVLDYFYNNGVFKDAIDHDFKKKYYYLMIKMVENSNKKIIK